MLGIGGGGGSPPDRTDPAEGFFVRDDFTIGNTGSGSIGEFDWFRGAAVGAVGSLSPRHSTSSTALGVFRLTSAGANADDTTVLYSARQLKGGFAVGEGIQARISPVQDDANCLFAFGVSSRGSGGEPLDTTAGNSRFVGFRKDPATSANVLGVVKSGAGAETTVDLGAVSVGTFVTYKVVLTAAGYQFSVSGVPTGAAIADAGQIDTNTGFARIWFGNTGAAAAKAYDIDFYHWHGRAVRI